MTAFLLTCVITSLGFEAGGSATFEKGLGKDVEEFSPSFSWGVEFGIRDLLPGIGLDLGFRRFAVEQTTDTSNQQLRWEGCFFDGAAVFESWPFLEGPLGIKLRTGGFYTPWRMLADGEVVVLPPTEERPDSVRMEEGDWGALIGGGVMFRPWKFLILELGVNHRHIFSLDTESYGKDDVDERFLEVYLGARIRFP